MEYSNKDKFKVGDFVIIKQENSNQITLGKIEEIFEEQQRELKFRYNEYYFPEKTHNLRREYHSKYEVFKTNEIEKELYNKILKKCEILKYDQFIRKLQIIKEKRIHNANSLESILENSFFYRQIYNASDNTYYPEIEPSCFCDKIFNPDKPFISCRECKELIHTECFVKSLSKNCFKCGNNLEAQLGIIGIGINSKYETYFIKHNNLRSNSALGGDAILGNKRPREEYFEKKTQNDSNQKRIPKEIKIEESGNRSNLDDNAKEGMTLTVSYPGEKAKGSYEEKTSYPNLNEERRKYLTNLIEKLESSNNADNADRSVSTEEKSRRTFRNKISYALLYGVEELKENGSWEKVKTKELNTPNINPTTAIKICNNNAIAIETAIFYNNGESIQNKYKTLLLNLMDPRNPELRFSILNGDIPAPELVKLTSEQLAPSRIKNMRTERQNKYFKEQVLMKEEMKIIAKTHKGESILNVESNDADYENENINKYESKFYESSFSQDNSNPLWSDEKSCLNNLKINDPNTNNKNNINTENFRKKNSITDENTNLIAKVHSKLNKDKEFKYKKINQEMQDFCKLLDDYTRDNLIHKLNEKLRTNLNPSTVNEIKDLEAKISNTI